MSETDIDPDTLAAALEQLDPGTRIGDKFVLSKRQLLAAAGGALSAGALVSMGIDEAEAQQAAGQVGTDSKPVELNASNYGSESVSGGFEVTIDGDTYQFNE
jgi:hypothetical protein